MMFGGSISRTQWTVMEAELGLMIELVVQRSFLHLHIFTNLGFSERGTAKNFWCSHWLRSLLLTPAKAESWLSLRGHAAAAANPTL